MTARWLPKDSIPCWRCPAHPLVWGGSSKQAWQRWWAGMVFQEGTGSGHSPANKTTSVCSSPTGVVLLLQTILGITSMHQSSTPRGAGAAGALARDRPPSVPRGGRVPQAQPPPPQPADGCLPATRSRPHARPHSSPAVPGRDRQNVCIYAPEADRDLLAWASCLLCPTDVESALTLARQILQNRQKLLRCI